MHRQFFTLGPRAVEIIEGEIDTTQAMTRRERLPQVSAKRALA
jgi:hypothetical protein